MPALQAAQVANFDFGCPAATIAAAVAATATLVFGTVATDTDLVQVGTPAGSFIFVYTSATPAAGHIGVATGLTATTSAQNLKAALNTALAGVVVASGAGTTLTLTASAAGKAGNSYTASKVSTAITLTSWAGGSDASASTSVLQFSVGGGGKLQLTFENPVIGWNGIGTAPAQIPVTVSVEVSTDGVTWAATTATANGAAVTNVAVPAGQNLEYDVVMRAAVDKFMRVNASGGGRCLMQARYAQSVRFDLIRM